MLASMQQHRFVEICRVCLLAPVCCSVVGLQNLESLIRSDCSLHVSVVAAFLVVLGPLRRDGDADYVGLLCWLQSIDAVVTVEG